MAPKEVETSGGAPTTWSRRWVATMKGEPVMGGAEYGGAGPATTYPSRPSSSTPSAASKAAVVSKKLLRGTGKAAWIAGTTFLILAVPLIIEMDRNQQLTEIELQNASLLGTTPTPK
ncbi:hypothetical protein CMV_000833 [Castanea mollissima]|uniref:Uncharacterized protein n=1 Tax=Castanea mollissima TaxID=60419 RepID=A0A8J4W4S6_9ROSI|nr:hypothetical protein CMV_000833 [Castanea mollissima]